MSVRTQPRSDERPADRPKSPDEVRADLVARLRARRSKIEQEIFAHARASSDPAGSADPEYVVGLRAAVAAGLDFVLVGIELERWDPAQRHRRWSHKRGARRAPVWIWTRPCSTAPRDTDCSSGT